MMAEIILNFPIVVFREMSIQILQYHATCCSFLTLPILKQTYANVSWFIVNVFVVFSRFNIFFCWFMSHSKTLRSYRDDIITCEGLQNVPRQLRPLCRERDLYHATLLASVCSLISVESACSLKMTALI